MLPVEKIRAELEDRKLTLVAEVTGLSYSTVRSFMKGDEGFSFKTAKLLSDYVERKL